MKGDKQDELTHLLQLQHEYDIAWQILTKTASYAFLYSDKQLNDIEKFCCCDGISDPFAIDIIFNLCDLWLTDALYRNRHLEVEATGKSPVFFGPYIVVYK